MNTKISQRRVVKRSPLQIGLALGIVLLVVFLGYLRFGPLSPDEVCLRTIRALESHDANALTALAHPEELHKLNLSAESARAVLADTLWNDGYSGRHRLSVYQHLRPDEVMYETKPEPGSSEKANTPLYITALDSPDKGWRLSLSQLLYYACFRRYAAVGDARSEWRAIKGKYGILGIQQSDGSYTLDAQQYGDR